MEQTETTQTRKQDIPLWLGLTLISLGLVAGGWFIYWQLSGYMAGKPKLFTIPGVEPGQYANMQPQPGQQRMPQNRTAAPVDDIRSVGNDNWRVRAGAMMLNIRKQGDKLTFQASILNPSTFHSDYAMTMLAKTRLKPDQLTAAGLSPEQIKLLMQVQGSALTYPAKLESADVETLSPLFNEWETAADNAKPAKAAAVAAAARKIAAQRLATAKSTAAGQVDAFRKTFSDEAWQKLRDAAIPKTTP